MLSEVVLRCMVHVTIGCLRSHVQELASSRFVHSRSNVLWRAQQAIFCYFGQVHAAYRCSACKVLDSGVHIYIHL